jgi:hypothetical protein
MTDAQAAGAELRRPLLRALQRRTGGQKLLHPCDGTVQERCIDIAAIVIPSCVGVTLG